MSGKNGSPGGSRVEKVVAHQNELPGTVSSQMTETAMQHPLVITTTFEQLQDAERLARLLLEQRLVACAHVTAHGQSLYWWQGNICEAMEYELRLKSSLELYPEIEARIRAEHPYQTPEIVATAIVAGSRDYLRWMEEELRK
jgi:periplasmic divalent cation tolerance protein